MSRDVILRAAGKDPRVAGKRWSLDNLSTQKWLDGHVPGAESAIARVMRRATDLFHAGKDAEAKMLRELAGELIQSVIPELREKANEFRAQHAAEWDLGKIDEAKSDGRGGGARSGSGSRASRG